MHLSRLAALSFLASLLLTACGGGGGGGGAAVGGGTGTLALSLTDAPTAPYEAVYVTVERILVHAPGGGWREVAAPRTTYDLLTLTQGVRAGLGLVDLPAGRYTQLRLVLDGAPDKELNHLGKPHPHAHYAVDGAHLSHELKVPSGLQSGIKLVKGFTISANRTTELILDFDASRSIVEAGASGKRLLKPVIRVLREEECALVEGRITDSVGPLAGARVTLQTYDPQAADPRDRVVTVATALASAKGLYAFLVDPGTPNLVVVAKGYAPASRPLVLQAGSPYTENMKLTAASAGTVGGTVQVAAGQGGEVVTLSFRQTIVSATATWQVEVGSLRLVAPTPYTIDLPVGLYEVVAHTPGRTTRVIPYTVQATGNLALDITFP